MVEHKFIEERSKMEGKDISHLTTEFITCTHIYHIQETGDFIIKDYCLILDPFSESEQYFMEGKAFSRHLLNCYNMDLEEAWNICHNFKADTIHKCPECGSKLNFIGKFGYSEFCGKICASIARNRILFSNPEYRERNANHLREQLKLNWQNPEYRKFQSENMSKRNLEW